jgi:hypothetical protein
MIDFINSVDSHPEIKPIELYELIKTDSSDLNSKILNNLQKHENINEFLYQYSKFDFKNQLNFLDNFESQSLLISNNEDKNIYKSKIDKYLSDISKIILSFLFIEKTNKILNNLLTNVTKTITEFYSENEKNSISSEINDCLNNLLKNCTPDIIQRNMSRRGTLDRTPKSKDQTSKRSSLLTDLTSGDTEFLVLDNNTPRFKVKELSNKSNGNDKKEDSLLKGSEKTEDSILSLKNMKFMSDTGDKTIRGLIKKNKTIKIGFDKQDSEFFFKQKSNSNKVNEVSSNLNGLNLNIAYNSNCLDKSQLLAALFNTINYLFENEQINLEQKLSLKQLLISDSENVINRLYKFKETNFPLNTNLKSIFKKFLISELENL